MGYIKIMQITEIIKLLLEEIWNIVNVFFKAFNQLSGISEIKERIIAAGLGIPIQVFTVCSFVVTITSISIKFLKKHSI